MSVRFVKMFLLFCLLVALNLQAQTGQYVRVQVSPNHGDWIYKRGEKVRFTVSVLKNNVPLENVVVKWDVSEDMMYPHITGEKMLERKPFVIQGGTMEHPGFLRCVVRCEYENKVYQGMATAAFEPQFICPTQIEPTDFDAFWEKAIQENNKIPMDPIVTLIPERCTGKVNVYQVSLQNYRHGSRFYGILCIPKKPGKYPAVLHFPGAGVRSYSGDVTNAEKGIITFQMEIHGIPHNLSTEVYQSLSNGALYDYMKTGLDNRDNYYYKRVYLACLRAVDFIYELPEFDKEHFCAHGGSQGGALAIITTALSGRVKCVAAHFPALCDLTGYLHDRAGGWPHLFQNGEGDKKEIGTTAYYDVVNFAKRIKVPIFYTLGYNDTTCPPTSTFSAYNVISAPKEIFIVEEAGHIDYPEQWEKVWRWIEGKLASTDK